MKKRILFFFLALALSLTSISYSSQIQYGFSTAIVTAIGQGTMVTFIDPITNQPTDQYAVLQIATVSGNPTRFYCVDITRPISFPDSCHRDSNVSDPKIVYILNNYYPNNPAPSGMLSDINQEVAATQLAIWYYSDGVDLNTVTDLTIRTRALQIKADADANGLNTTVLVTFSIKLSVNPDYFYIETLDQNGNGIAVNNIILSISQGSLSTNVVSTNSSGISPDVEVIGTNSGIIQADAIVPIPQGITYTCPQSQRLVLANTVYGERRTTEDWGALPVELSSFNADVNGRNVRLNWTTASESNNSGFNIERKQAGSNDWKTVGNVQGNGTSNNSNSYSFADKNVATGKYSYRLKQIDFNGNFEYHVLNSEIEVGSPAKFNLYQNYPNPFNPTTKIDFDITDDGFVSLKIYNSSGKEIATLVSGFTTSGYHSVAFDASNISSGIYYYKLETNGNSKVMKMVLVK